MVHALILDVIIHPERQGEGIGKEIMDKLVTKCKKHNIRDIQLFSAKDKAGFYERLVEKKILREWKWRNTGNFYFYQISSIKIPLI